MEKKISLEQFAVDYFEAMLNEEDMLECAYCPLRKSCANATVAEYENNEPQHTCREWLNRNMDW